jgi:hypothetical protein
MVKKGEVDVNVSTAQQIRPMTEASLLGGAIAAGMLFWGPGYQKIKARRQKESRRHG